jgi:hypothetical protein
LDTKVDITQASEPTDIIWECQGNNETEIQTMKLWAGLKIALMLVSFVIVYTMIK